jgi:hypothetical protein
MEDIGKIVFDSNFNTLEATTRGQCGERIWDRLNLWRENAERIMVEASADELSMVRGADQFLSPIVTILDNLQNPINGKPIITIDDVKVSSQNMLKYLSLLEDLQIVKAYPERKEWSYGPLFTPLLEKARERQMAFERVVFAHILKNRYSAIRDIFRISVFEKIIHLDSCYYSAALEVEKPIATQVKNVIAQYKAQYNDEDEDNLTLNSKIQELARVHALRIENGYCVGEPNVLKEMVILKLESAKRGLPRA